jgi:hypothetical protein
MALTLLQPTPNKVVPVGISLPVAGTAQGRGMPEPIFIEKITVQVDDEVPIDVEPKHLSGGLPPRYTFRTDIITPGTVGEHTIQVKAINDSGGVAGDATVPFFVGASIFDCSGTLKIDFFATPDPIFFDNERIVEIFSDDRRTVTIVNFPPLDSMQFSLPFPLGDDDVTVTLVGGGTGAFDPGSGNMSVPVTLDFHHSNSVFSDSTLEVILTTGASAHGRFSDQGKAMQSNGSMTLVGDGAFQGGVLGGSDASLVITGTMSPHP